MPELTGERFVERVIDGAAERLYRTGDYGLPLPDGNIVFQGREDGQVKVRGFRIELGEIAHHLEDHHAVRQSFVTVDPRPEGDAVLAFVVADVPCTSDSLRDHLRARLPEYMLPERIHLCAALPLTETGKVDRHALIASTAKPS
jgi:acyl-coenzyme A synthetase/AMP-(fatty) acid ligase